jgi:hypothetical protein
MLWNKKKVEDLPLMHYMAQYRGFNSTRRQDEPDLKVSCAKSAWGHVRPAFQEARDISWHNTEV